MLSIGSDDCSEVDWQMASQQGSFLAKDQRAYISGEETRHKPPFCFVLKGVMLDSLAPTRSTCSLKTVKN